MERATDWIRLWRELVEVQARRWAAREQGQDEDDAWKDRAHAFDTFVRKRWTRPDSSRRTMIAALQERPGATVLDIGAGTGSWAALLARHARLVTAVEPSPAMIEVMERNLADEGIENVRIVQDTWPEAQVAVHDFSLCSHAMYGCPDLPAFIQRMIDVTRQTCFLVMRAPTGVGLQLGAQHSQNFESWFVHVPGLKVVLPATPADAKGLLKSAIRDPDPVIFLEHELIYLSKGEVPAEDYAVPLGVADVKREGADVTIITYSRMTLFALKAAERLAERGISAEVVDLRTLRPLDIDTVVESVRKTHRAVVCEEDWPMCGMAAEVIAQIQTEAFDDLDAPILRVSGVDVPMPYAKNLEKMAVPGEEDVYQACLRVTEGHRD